MKTAVLSVPVSSEVAFSELLRRGGFDVAPLNNEPWATDRVSWQGFLCHRGGAIVCASVTIDQEGKTEPFVAVHPCRKLLWLWTRACDRRLVQEVVNHLMQHGGRPPSPAADQEDTDQQDHAR